MKQTRLLLALLTLYCGSSHAASDAIFSSEDNKVTVPYVNYQGQLYQMDMTFEIPNRLVIDEMKVRTGGLTPAPGMIVPFTDNADFRLSSLQVGSEFYQMDLISLGGNQFQMTNLHGRLINLGTLDPTGGSFSYAYGISNNGLVTGRSRVEVKMGGGKKVRGPISAARFFNNGLVQDLGAMGGARAQGRAIDDTGTVVGFSMIKTEDKTDVRHAFIHKFKKGYMQDMGTLGNGNESRAYGVNKKGTAVGWSAAQADSLDNVAFTYDIESETMASLGGDLLGGERSFAFDINDNDQIVGTATTANGSALAFLYENGTATNLGSLDNSGFSEAWAINNNGQVTGRSLDADKNYTAFIYDANGMKSLGGLGGDSHGYDINNHGDVVGSARDVEDGQHAFLYRDGKILDLYTLLAPEDQLLWKELREAYSINDKGVIVGRGRYWTNKEKGRSGSRAFMLTIVR